MKYMLDTNICIYIIKKHPANVLKKLLATDPSDVCISSISLAELKYGVEKSQRQIQNRQSLSQFILSFSIKMFDDEAADHYGKIRAELESKGTLIGPLDLLIAAHARSLGSMLITNNVKEFTRVSHLKISDWQHNQ